MRRLTIILAIAKAACLGQIWGTQAGERRQPGRRLSTNYGWRPDRALQLGPALASDASQSSAGTQLLGEASVKVTVSLQPTAGCYPAADRVIALLPSSTPVGDGAVTVTRARFSPPLRFT
jgi:hypothetical protein